MRIRRRQLYEMIASSIGRMIEEGKKALGDTSITGRFAQLLQADAKLRMMGMTLFNENPVLVLPSGSFPLFGSDTLDKFIAEIQKTRSDNREEILENFFFNNNVFANEEAIVYAQSILYNTKPWNCRADMNRYVSALGNMTKVTQGARQESDDQKNLEKNKGQQKKLNMWSEIDKINNHPAFYFYLRTRNKFPIDIDAEHADLDRAEKELEPYFQKEPEYGAFMKIRSICVRMSNPKKNRNTHCAYDGQYIVFNWVKSARFIEGTNYLNPKTLGRHLMQYARTLWGILHDNMPSDGKAPKVGLDTSTIMDPDYGYAFTEYTYADHKGKLIGFWCPIERYREKQ